MADLKPPFQKLFRMPNLTEETSRQLKTKFNLDPDFFSELIVRLQERENDRPTFMDSMRGIKSRPPSGWVHNPTRPTRSFTNLGQSIISQLIELVFWASLERDEGRPMRFSVAYRCLTNENTSDDSIFEPDIIFDSPLPFTVKELKKLGPAISREASILVFANSDNELKIRGISTFESLPLKLTILDPGHLTISYYGENVAFVSGSEVGFIKFSGFDVNSLAVWQRLYSESKEGFRISADIRFQVITRTLRKMRDLGGGGALIIVPKRKKFSRSIESTAYPTPKGFDFLSKIIKELNEGKDELNLREMYVEYLATTLAHLTAVDGATIITKDIELIGFGVKLKKRNQPSTIYMTHPIDHPERWKSVGLTDVGNLRHQSAACFIASEKDAIAFVVSQDGNITSFVWLEDQGIAGSYLLVDSRLDLTLF